MGNHVIEVVTFKLADGVSEAEFLKTVPASNDFLNTRDGFISRRLSRDDQGTWMEHIEWETLAAATAASEAFMNQASLKPLMQAIDGANAKMSHNQLMISVG